MKTSLCLQQVCHTCALRSQYFCDVPVMQLLQQLPSPSQQADQVVSFKQQGVPLPLMATGVQQATPHLVGEGQGPQVAAEAGAGHPPERPLSACPMRTLILKR